MTRFATITGGMVGLLGLALWQGGFWAVAALLYVTVFAFFMDRIAALQAPDLAGQEFPAGTGLSVALGLVHFPLLFGGVFVLASHGIDAGALVLYAALGLFFGQVSNSNAHELIHRQDRALYRLGVLVYASLLFGHHVSAHLRVHHVHTASAGDPNSARLGEGYYRFAMRAWTGSFRKGLTEESRRLAAAGRPRWRHPYLAYVAGAGASLAIAWGVGGGAGLGWLVALAAYAQMQLLLSDYVQHYGLRRAQAETGRLEPVGPQHSWNAPHGFSSGLMLNAPRHSDHHARPKRAYPGLELDRTAMPILPHSLPVMAVVALWPPAWRRIMDRRARDWAETARAADSRFKPARASGSVAT